MASQGTSSLDTTQWDLTLGIHAGDAPHPNGAEENEHLTVAQIAAKHEYGDDRPQRSWLRGFIDDKRPQIQAELNAAFKAILSGKDEVSVMNQLALRLGQMCRDRFDEGIGPALSPATKAAKGSSLQLVETGLLRASVTAEARRK